jgi:hypothetical protein
MTKFKPGDVVEIVSKKHNFHVVLRLLSYSTNRYNSFYAKVLYCPVKIDYKHINVSKDMLYSKGYFKDHSSKKLPDSEYWEILYG